MLEIVILYLFAGLVVVWHGASAIVSFFILKSLKDTPGYSPKKDISLVLQNLFYFLIKRKTLFSIKERKKALLYVAAVLIFSASFSFLFLGSKYLIDGSLHSVDTELTLSWFITHIVNVSGMLIAWHILYTELEENE